MRLLVPATLAAALLVAACGGARDQAVPDSGHASATLNALFDEYFERNLEMNPLQATFIGDYRYNDRMANINSPEYRAASTAMDEEFLQRLLAIDRAQLGYQDRLSYDLFKIDREQSLEGNQFPSHLAPITQFGSITSLFVQLGSGASAHPFKTVKDYDDFLSRADQFAINVDQIITNMREGMREGIVQPRILMAKLVPQLESQLDDNPKESSFFTPVRDMPDDYLLAARETVGLSALPNGDNWYAYLVRVRTTTDMTPDEIHQIGLDEVARIHDEMRGVMEEVRFDGELEDFFEFVNTDDQFFFDEAEELIQGYRDMSERISELAKNLFDVFPETAFEVRRVEPLREQTASKGSYTAGTADGARPGIFYANAYDIKARGKWAMESLFLHEAIPGHHFQIMIQRENEDLPGFRRYGGFTAFSEGWGLYAESLGKELGVFTDPYQYFGGLNAELWRAIRLVVDTGIHAKGWSRQQVLDYMYENSAVAPVRAVAEAERFMAIPGQALAYKVGQLKIRDIRKNAEARLGDRFDVRSFHTEVLKDGAMPLSMLEAKVNRWVAAQL
jgi:uncharacterized protein (DUF885 family)